MNTRRGLALLLIVVGCAVVARGSRRPFDYSSALPSRKAPIAVSIRRNPFQAASEPEKPLPVLRDKDDPVTKLPSLLSGHIRSVLREPRPLLLVDDAVYQPGDEVRLRREPLLPKYRVTLRSIEDDRLVFQAASLDPQQPGQVEATLPLVGSMRKE